VSNSTAHNIWLLLDLHQIGVTLFSVASVLSLLFVIAKPLGKEFEAVALQWIRAFRRVQAEWRKPIQLPPSSPRRLEHSKRE
jgi:hypothetical protein